MATIVTRAGKGSPLTNTEVDSNFTNLNDGLATAAITGGTINGATIGASSAAAATVTTLTATSDSAFTSTGAVTISKGADGDRPGTPVKGMLRYNTTSDTFEGYSGSSPAWGSLGSGGGGSLSLSDDTTTNSTRYPLFAAATSGSVSTEYVSSTKYTYNPSTGTLTAPVLNSQSGFFLSASSVTTSYTVNTGYNAMSVGPISIASGVAVTVASGQRWVVL
jgi:hypothetical protein